MTTARPREYKTRPLAVRSLRPSNLFSFFASPHSTPTRSPACARWTPLPLPLIYFFFFSLFSVADCGWAQLSPPLLLSLSRHWGGTKTWRSSLWWVDWQSFDTVYMASYPWLTYTGFTVFTVFWNLTPVLVCPWYLHFNIYTKSMTVPSASYWQVPVVFWRLEIRKQPCLALTLPPMQGYVAQWPLLLFKYPIAKRCRQSSQRLAFHESPDYKVWASARSTASDAPLFFYYLDWLGVLVLCLSPRMVSECRCRKTSVTGYLLWKGCDVI